MLAVVLLEQTVSLSLGGGSTVVVLQGPGDLLHGHQGLVARRGSLSFQDGKACGIAAEGVWMECSTCALFSRVVLMPCDPPTVVFPPSHSQMELLLISAP